MSTTAHVENLLYGGRTLVGYTEQGERIAGWPKVAYESIRAINHLTNHGPVPAPTLRRILGELKGIGHPLPQACAQLARGLEESLQVLDLYDHRAGFPPRGSPSRNQRAEVSHRQRPPLAVRRAGRRAMTDPIAARRSRTAPSGLLLKAAVVIPGVIISTLLWLVIIAALPPAIGFGLTIAGLTVSAVLAAGLAEDTTVRLLYRARRATPFEAPRLAVAWRLATHRLDAADVRLRIIPHGTPVATAGRHHVLLRRDVADAYCANEIAARQVADLIAHGIGRLRHGYTRFDLLWTVWTIPWDLIRCVAYTIGRRLARIPLVQFAWRIRPIVGTIAVVLETQAGRWPSPIIIACLMGLSYLMPRSRQAWEARLAGVKPTMPSQFGASRHPSNRVHRHRPLVGVGGEHVRGFMSSTRS